MALDFSTFSKYKNAGKRGMAIAASDSEMPEDLPNGSPKPQKRGFGDFANSANGILQSMGGLGAKGGDLLAGLPEMFGADSANGFSEDEKASQSTIRNALGMIPGYGQLIAAATGAVDAIGTATGLNLSTVDNDTAKRSGVSGT